MWSWLIGETEEWSLYPSTLQCMFLAVLPLSAGNYIVYTKSSCFRPPNVGWYLHEIFLHRNTLCTASNLCAFASASRGGGGNLRVQHSPNEVSTQKWTPLVSFVGRTHLKMTNVRALQHQRSKNEAQVSFAACGRLQHVADTSPH